MVERNGNGRAEATDGRVFHLTPDDVWQRQREGAIYMPEAYEQDGFIHCTSGSANVIVVGNRYYRGDDRPYVALELDPAILRSPVKLEDPAGIYPHIYGPLNLDAVIRVHTVERSADGTFVGIYEVR